ncbi:MAG TPA: ABC transporter substrate-binding protein [Stellaceae bacterium]|nr:ABC transporter substrate-binding protein [Stellaceae bacterium]
MKTTRALTALLMGSALALAVTAAPSLANDKVKAGVVRSMGGSPNYVGKEKGFFAAQGIDVDIVFFDSAQPISVAVASGDCDVGTTGVTAAFFNLAAQGALRIIGSGTWEHPGFQSIGYLVSNQAYDAGLHSLKDIAGKKAAITQSGTPLQYAIALAADKYHIDYSKIQVLLLQSNPNVGTALTGGQTDFAVQTVVPAYSVINKGGAKLLGWEGDQVPNEQNEAFFTSVKMMNERPDVLKRYLIAYRQAMTYLHDAFADESDKRRDGPNANEAEEIAAKSLDQPLAQIKLGVPFFDAQGRLVEQDFVKLAAWYKSQGMIKGDIDVPAMIDRRDAIPYPKK